MTPEFEYQNRIANSFQKDVPTLNSGRDNEPTPDMDMLKRDRFELLSAYLDGEVTATERRQVEEWLTQEPEVQQLYARLLNLRQGMQTIPLPAAEAPVEQTVNRVFAKVNQRRRLAAVWGGSAIAALFVGALSGAISERQMLRIADATKAGVNSKPLMVAINTPVVAIPKAAIAAPEQLPVVWPNQQKIDNSLN